MARATARKPVAIPKSLGACADKLWEMQQERYGLQRAAETMKKDETVIKDHIINNVPKGDEGAVGKHHIATTETVPAPQIEDWAKICAWMIKKKDFSIIKKEIIGSRVLDLMDDGVKIPGVIIHKVVKVHLTKRS